MLNIRKFGVAIAAFCLMFAALNFAALQDDLKVPLIGIPEVNAGNTNCQYLTGSCYLGQGVWETYSGCYYEQGLNSSACSSTCPSGPCN